MGKKLSNVIKQSLETAAEKAKVSYEMNGMLLTTSVINAFEETFQKYKI